MIRILDRRTTCAKLPLVAAAAAGLLTLASGCDRTLDTTYAAIRGPSINGISTFVQLLRAAGHETTVSSLVPADDDPRCATLVVFADRFGPLESAETDRLRRFLDAGGPRTLVMVLRDGDCVIDYWRALDGRPDLAPAQRERIRAALAAARDEFAKQLFTTAAPCECHLETVARAAAAGPTRVEMRSAGGFADDAVAARWELHRRLVPPAEAQVLWRAGDEPLLVRTARGESSIVVLASATPLLNGGLVDPGNRRLAENLLARLPPAGRVHVAASAAVLDADAGREPSMWRLLAVAPHPWIAAQALAAMAIFCWWRAPIVGRPRRADPAIALDFGHHVAALGGLLGRARGADFARRRIDTWRRLAAAGVAERGPPRHRRIKTPLPGDPDARRR